MATMRVMLVRAPGEALTLEERPLPQPGPGEVRVKVAACGICHSDAFTVQGGWPGIAYPRAPGHEIAGTVDALGAGVTTVRAGDRVGIGWCGGYDGTCPSCRRGSFVTCADARVPGISYDGGYADYVVVQEGVLAPLPPELSFDEAAPLMCAGITVYNALRHADARPGDLVAVLGIGGLGHLGVQFAAKMGFATVAIARGHEKDALARRLGAIDYIDSEKEDVAERLQAHGGARVVLATATSADAMTAAVGGLGIDGTLLIVGASAEPLRVPPIALIGGRKRIQGWPSGDPADIEDTLRFAALAGIRPMIETVPLERANEGFAKMMSNRARFRMVLAH